MPSYDLVRRAADDFSAPVLSRSARAAIQSSVERSLVAARRMADTGFVAKVALWEVSDLSRLQSQLELLHPEASPRLNLVADQATEVIAAQLLALRCR